MSGSVGHFYFGKFSLENSDVFFQGQTLFWPYLRNGWSDWCETKRKCNDWILGAICDLDLWPHSWPWPWMFKVKFRNSSISGIVGLIDVKWKRSELIWYWADCMTLPFDHTHDPKSKNVIYNSFIRSNFEYCPLVWHFCGKTNNNKLEKIQERSLRILHDTYELSYEELLNKNGSNTLLLHRLKLLIMETYKSFHCINANCLHGVFKFNSTSHEQGSDKLIQPKRRTSSNGLRSFSYLGSKLWNDLVNSDPAIANCDFNEIMVFLKQWEAPDMNDSFPYVWIFSCDQAALQIVFSVCPSVRLSHLFDYVPIIVSSWNFQDLLPRSEVKGQGHRGHNPT